MACTDIRVTAKDGTVLIGRSMEFAVDMNSRLMSTPRGKIFTNSTNDGQPALSWKNRYGYVFLDGFNIGAPIDGLNEHGLSLEGLYLPGETQYQTIPKGQENQGLPYFRFGDWVLGNFKTVDEVKQALSRVYVFAQKTPQTKNLIFPLHFSIYDASGKGIVVEYVGGKMNVYDNNIGVLTNSPAYHWQTSNLRNYLNLSPSTPKPVIDRGAFFVATGQGGGMVGLPGDSSPPSRFVKMSVMLRTAFTPDNADGALNLAQHIINNVDIPLGFVRETQNVNTATNELTQWVVFKDLTHKILYYRTYNDLTLRAINLTKLNFSAESPVLTMPIQSKQSIVDMTPLFISSQRKVESL